MNYFIEEVLYTDDLVRTAGNKARDDISTILLDDGFKKMLIDVHVNDKMRDQASKLKKMKFHYQINQEWKRKLSTLKQGDNLLIQFPILNHSLFVAKTVEKVQAKGVHIILLIHDLEMFRVKLKETTSEAEKKRITAEEINLLKSCDKIIAHNADMKQALVDLGFEADKIVLLEVFDYVVNKLGNTENYAHAHSDGNIIIAGNLRRHKAAYAYDLPDNVNFNLYGIDYNAEPKDNVHYLGSFLPDELPSALDGSFGLVWDGTSVDTCTGTYGQYLKINNPHKVSLYLASGMPIAIWKEAALAKFVEEHKCGITISSIGEIEDKLKNMSEEEYEELKNNTIKESTRLRKGYYTKKAVAECLKQ
ncbi:galactofuranosyltransferase [Sharpea azabuensis]|uniref:galactofuranosyltransferase n=1 Tax=Sharpea azabuensis TaxID=322505 RepID=UPI001568754B|nr:galactofuranosyltransferase [Sharpea azabuensis]